MTEYARTRPHLADQLTASKVIQLVEAGGGAKAGRQAGQGKAGKRRYAQRIIIIITIESKSVVAE